MGEGMYSDDCSTLTFTQGDYSDDIGVDGPLQRLGPIWARNA